MSPIEVRLHTGAGYYIKDYAAIHRQFLFVTVTEWAELLNKIWTM